MKLWKGIVLLLVLAALSVGVFIFSVTYWGIWHDDWSGYNASLYIGDGVCNIAVLPILGTIMPYDDEYEPVVTTPKAARSFLEQAQIEPGIYGVLVEIDSYGGTPAASETIMREVLRTTDYIPVASLIGDLGVSGAYLAAIGAETVYASPFSDVGGLGITMSYLSYAEQNEAEGVVFEELTSAPFKNYGNPDRPLTEAERELIERDLDYMHDYLIDLVAIRRGLERERVVELADGASMPGELALQNGLIDRLGGRYELKEWFAEQLEMSPEDIIYCSTPW